MNWKAKSSTILHLPTSWQELQQGEYYQQLLEQYFADWFPQILGYHILNIGGLSGEINCHLPLRHQIVLSPKMNDNLAKLYQTHPDHTLLQAHITELPFVDHSIDACLLVNTLNFSSDPHQVLREVNRVLTDDGYLFLSLFNPLSILGFKRRLNRKSSQEYAFRTYMTWRVVDWLELLHFDILAQQNLSLTKSFLGAPLTVIVAKKRVYPLTLEPQKVRFKKQNILRTAEAFRNCL
ncbi:class I SAM-dependent methyltransferase [Conservatibacter flavescens]|uniref:SAM-dependent methyltransferase n=1 Tax=Conservatibacter flavescens TaxID=28161 RepID=A0A2M8S5N3_9PAST|nr:class I SAM-dependent methyltransferase [Conservatibacter flavescens]PJG86447.1 SAM-dependent methyltransferase [Conservatibacter flavescens]